MKNRVKKYYKVVKLDCFSARSSYSVHYRIGEFVKALYKGTPLCVFDNLADAMKFREDGEIIYECKVKSVFRKPWIPFYTSAAGDIIDKMTSNQFSLCGYYNIPRLISDRIKQHKKISHLVHTNLPKGTVCVREVKLIRKVG